MYPCTAVNDKSSTWKLLHTNPVEIRAIHATWKWYEGRCKLGSLHWGREMDTLAQVLKLKTTNPKFLVTLQKKLETSAPHQNWKTEKWVFEEKTLSAVQKYWMLVRPCCYVCLYLTSNKIFRPEVCLHAMWALLTNVPWLQA